MAPDRRSRFENQTFRVFSTARNEALNRFRRPPSERKSICLIAAFHALWAQTRTEDRTKRTEGAARLRAAQHRNYLADGHCTSIDAAEWRSRLSVCVFVGEFATTYVAVCRMPASTLALTIRAPPAICTKPMLSLSTIAEKMHAKSGSMAYARAAVDARMLICAFEIAHVVAPTIITPFHPAAVKSLFIALAFA